jgi:predicted sugar kinase
MGSATATLNTAWTEMVRHSANEKTFQTKASIDYATLTAGAQLPITAFIPALAGYGKDTQTGMAAEFLESIANTANQSGQAMVGALREGRNTAGIDAVGLKIDNGVPSQPNAVPPQATLSNSEYTVAEARALC